MRFSGVKNEIRAPKASSAKVIAVLSIKIGRKFARRWNRQEYQSKFRCARAGMALAKAEGGSRANCSRENEAS
jgi:hypothetical protein